MRLAMGAGRRREVGEGARHLGVRTRTLLTSSAPTPCRAVSSSQGHCPHVQCTILGTRSPPPPESLPGQSHERWLMVTRARAIVDVKE